MAIYSNQNLSLTVHSSGTAELLLTGQWKKTCMVKGNCTQIHKTGILRDNTKRRRLRHKGNQVCDHFNLQEAHLTRLIVNNFWNCCKIILVSESCQLARGVSNYTQPALAVFYTRACSSLADVNGFKKAFFF